MRCGVRMVREPLLGPKGGCWLSLASNNYSKHRDVKQQPFYHHVRLCRSGISNRTWLGDTFVPCCVDRVHSMVFSWWMDWFGRLNTTSFTHLAFLWGWLEGWVRLGQWPKHVYMWSVLCDSFRIPRLLTWFLRAPRVSFPGSKAGAAKPYDPASVVTLHHLLHSLLAVTISHKPTQIKKKKTKISTPQKTTCQKDFPPCFQTALALRLDSAKRQVAGKVSWWRVKLWAGVQKSSVLKNCKGTHKTGMISWLGEGPEANIKQRSYSRDGVNSWLRNVVLQRSGLQIVLLTIPKSFEKTHC